MRKVILLVTLSSERFHYVPGQEAEFSADEAQRLVDEHYAKFVDEVVVPIEEVEEAVETVEEIEAPI
jgi:hypothetical protein